jgi:hypothetical protein
MLIIYVTACIADVRLLVHYMRANKRSSGLLCLKDPVLRPLVLLTTAVLRWGAERWWRETVRECNVLGKGWLITAPNDPIPTWQGQTSDRPRPSAFTSWIDCRPGMHLHITDWVSIARKTQSLNYKQFLSHGKHTVSVTNWVSIAWKTHSLSYKLSFYRMENTQSQLQTEFLSHGKHTVSITNWVSIAWKTQSLYYKLSFYRMENTQSKLQTEFLSHGKHRVATEKKESSRVH